MGRVCRDEGGGREQGGGWRRRSGDRTSRTLQRVPILCKEIRAVSGGTCFCYDKWLPASDLESLWGPFLERLHQWLQPSKEPNVAPFGRLDGWSTCGWDPLQN